MIPIFVAIVLLLLPAPGRGDDGGPPVYRVPIEGTIDLGIPPFVERSLEEAERAGAGLVVFEINTFGGRIDAATRIRDRILDAPVRTVAFVNKRAISAGALITLACGRIFMAPGSTIGAATPVQMGPGGGKMEKAEEKVVSYFRSEMRATAERNGRPPEIAEAMVDESIAIEGVVEEGKLLTLTTEEAIDLEMADGAPSSFDEILSLAAPQGAVVVSTRMNWAEKVVRFFTNPVLSGLLLTAGFLGILLELRTPGIGLPGIAGLLFLAIFFGIHYVVHLAGLGELLLFLLGLVLLAAEIFLIPGFGIAGVAGIALVLGTVAAGMVGRLPLPGDLARAAAVVTTSLVASVAGLLLLFRFLPSRRAVSGLVLSARERKDDGFDVTPHADRSLAGARGVTVTRLRPAGLARFGDRRVDVVSEGEFLGVGEEVDVISISANRVVVRRASP